MPRTFRLAFLLGAIGIATSLHAAELFPLYQKLQNAIAADDWSAAKALLAREKLDELDDRSEQDSLAAIDVISPKEKLRAYKEIIDGDDATLIVTANVAENASTGRIEFVREDGAWKILSERWDIGGKPEDALANDVRQPKNDSEREAIRKLRAMGYATPSAEFLVMAAVDGNLEAVQLFVQAGYSVNEKGSDGSSVLVSAAMFGKYDVVDWLIDHGADVNASDGAATALHRLADKCDATPTILKLIAKGAKTDVKTAGGATALQIAEALGCTENAKALAK